MISGDFVALLNPVGSRAREIVKAAPPLSELPEEIAEMAVSRVSNPSVDLPSDRRSIERDVLSLHLLCAGVASVSYPYSPEARLVEQSVKTSIRRRMFELFKRGLEGFCLEAVREVIRVEPLSGRRVRGREIAERDYFLLRDRELERIGYRGREVDQRVVMQCVPRFAIRWTDLSSLLKHRRVRLTDLYLLDGWAILSSSELWRLYSELVGAQVEELIEELYNKLSQLHRVPDVFARVGSRVSQLVPKEKLIPGIKVKRGRLRPEFFPPCIKKCLQGVPEGVRNFAITLLLVSFLSRARICPRGKPEPKVSEFVEDLSVVRDELLPIIYEAAERCNPPLFSDQPEERANIWYVMGFGRTENPTLADSGRSKWYMTPSCEKIRLQAPILCQPDEYCAGIRNPLTYYFKRLSEEQGSA